MLAGAAHSGGLFGRPANDQCWRPGLGAHLFEALNRRSTVVGVAKTAFAGAPAVPVLRGRSHRPLFIAAAGVEPDVAAAWIRAMHRRGRIPTLLARADRLARQAL